MNMDSNICRLCLKLTSSNNFEIIDQITTEILEKLLLNLNLNISKEPVICNDCADKLQKSIDFKSVCYHTEEEILLFTNPYEASNMNSKEIHLKSNKTVEVTYQTCCFCKRRTGQDYFTSFEESKKNVFMADMMKKYIPHLNFALCEDTIICNFCIESIQCFYAFILNCLDAEEKIEKYIEKEGKDDKGQVNLNNVKQFTFGSTLEYEFNHKDVDSLKMEETNNEINYKNITVKGIDSREIKSNHIQQFTHEQGLKYVSCGNVLGKNEVGSDVIEAVTVKTETINENLIEEKNMALDELYIKYEETGIKSDDYESFQEEVTFTPKKMKIANISPEVRNKRGAKSDTSLTNPDGLYECNLCLFKTKYKKSLRRHRLTHENPEDVMIFTCDVCPYKSKHKHNLIEHMLVHKNPSEIQMFKCTLCSYEAKRKNNLIKHMVMHKSPAEISMFKCLLCTYEAKFPSDLKNHMISHKDVSEAEMYRCETCMFETKHKGYLKKHMRIHQLEPEFRMFMCDECSFKTRHRHSLNQHKLSHKTLSEVTMFTCQICSFQTRYKKVLGGHMVMHKDPSEITMYKCELCPYETKRKYYLKMHALIHQNSSDITMYQCEMCKYQTKRKCYLKQHMVTHKK